MNDLGSPGQFQPRSAKSSFDQVGMRLEMDHGLILQGHCLADEERKNEEECLHENLTHSTCRKRHHWILRGDSAICNTGLIGVPLLAGQYRRLEPHNSLPH